jgi:small subunit ribosomal protein S17
MNNRRRLTGVVISDKMMKTIIIAVKRTYRHPLYQKVVFDVKKYKAHDELECKVGDKVRIVECRPISREVRWTVEEILEKSVQLETNGEGA